MEFPVNRLKMGPSDSLVITSDDPLSADQVARLKRAWDDAGEDRSKIRVLDAGLRLTILARDEETSMSVLAGMVS